MMPPGDVRAARAEILARRAQAQWEEAQKRQKETDHLLEELRAISPPLPSRWDRLRCLLFGHYRSVAVPWCWRCWAELE